MFKTQYDSRERTVSNAWNRIAPVYELAKGQLKKVGEKDVYAEIQSHAESCDIKIMIARLQSGDTSMIRNVSYMDITDMPKNLAEAYQMVNQATADFNNLPLEVRREYEFNPENYIHDLGTDHWKELVFQKKEETHETGKEIITDEQK